MTYEKRASAVAATTLGLASLAMALSSDVGNVAHASHVSDNTYQPTGNRLVLNYDLLSSDRYGITPSPLDAKSGQYQDPGIMNQTGEQEKCECDSFEYNWPAAAATICIGIPAVIVFGLYAIKKL